MMTDCCTNRIHFVGMQTKLLRTTHGTRAGVRGDCNLLTDLGIESTVFVMDFKKLASICAEQEMVPLTRV
jgi:hypothetical protein